MSIKRQPKPAAPKPRGRKPWLGIGVALGILGMSALALWLRPGRTSLATPKAFGPLAYQRDIAPLILTHCAPCHHPGEAAPFDLLTYADVQKRTRLIRDLVTRRLMPPWLPDPKDGPFIGQRGLNDEEIARIQQWIDQGAPETIPGVATTNAIAPTWSQGWQLGRPDLVVQMPEPYSLAAEGPDVYRNFVIPIPTRLRRFVRAVELRPENQRVVHHAFMRIDTTRECRRWDARDAEPGFPGLHTPLGAQTPPGQFLSWQPGKLHTFGHKGLAWTLEPQSDLLLQVHLRPSGKPEKLQAQVGFYFTDEAPTNSPFKIGLRTYALDIPAGESNYVFRESYALAADVEVLSVLPHAHYLARRVEAFATWPDGRRQSLLRIGEWDFNWQGDYVFQKPVFLPKGTTLAMAYQYDNSTNNAQNPNQPPQRVRYGLQSTDEMAELWLQVLPVRREDVAALTRYDQPRAYGDAIAYNQFLLGQNPQDASAHAEIGKARLFLGQSTEAEASLRQALALDAKLDEPHYFLGLMFRMQNRLEEAAAEFTDAVQLNPANAKAHGNLGLIRRDQGQAHAAETHLRAALRLNPEDQLARQALQELLGGKGKL